MSDKSVYVRRVGDVARHPNADRLDIVSFEGILYRCVVGRDQVRPGDLVAYFPVDTVLPEPLLVSIGLSGKLAGKQHNRVKTVKLRGEFSQGLAVPLSDVDKYIVQCHAKDDPQGLCPLPHYALDLDLTDILGITIYEPPEPTTGTGVRPAYLTPLPTEIHVYDIENAENYPAVVHRLMDAKVSITEKIEGTHVIAACYKGGRYLVGTRKNELVVTEEATKATAYWQACAKLGVEGILRSLVESDKVDLLTLRGELVGPCAQGNYYGLKENTIYWFEVEVNGHPMPAEQALAVLTQANLNTVPELYRGKMSLAFSAFGGNLDSYATRQSVINSAKLAEGIVIRPLDGEASVPDLGRVILKVRSKAYLVKQE